MGKKLSLLLAKIIGAIENMTKIKRKYSKIEVTLIYDGRSKLIRESKSDGVQEVMDIVDKISDMFPNAIMKATLKAHVPRGEK
jgi:hypothetical protein